jgi:hypothetical protein
MSAFGPSKQAEAIIAKYPVNLQVGFTYTFAAVETFALAAVLVLG